jgi:heavy metal translocating P-type ATPase
LAVKFVIILLDMTIRIPVPPRVLKFARHYWQFSLALIVLIVGLLLQLIGVKLAAHWLLGITSLLLCIPILVGMWDDIQSGSYGIDVLALTAIIGSVLLHQYWAAIVIVLMLTGGAALEDYANHRAQRELTALLAHAPQIAHVLRGRKVLELRASEVNVGDKILIKPGEVVPVDAVIIEGTSSFDESSLTGESLPVSKSEAGTILSGSIALDGIVTARAIHSAADSQYQQIVALVRSADAKQAPFVRLADRYSIPFTICAYLIATAAWYAGHREALRFLEVIVVATPCPLLLAAPIALISGMSRASKHGIIVRTAATLEKLAEAETFAFDKTGTLTQGKVEVDTITALNPYTKNEVLAMAASLEQGSAHILAQSIVQAAHDKHISFSKAKHVQEYTGLGMRATLHGKEVLVGQIGLLDQHSITVPAKQRAKQTAAYVTVNGELIGIIAFHDKLRSESKATLQQLRDFGIKHYMMITGDSEDSAQAIAKQLNIDIVLAGAKPADKLHAIEKLTNRPVAFVGDGVNDAPVLTAADIGIALGARGSTAASESADVIILPDDISFVATAVGISRRTFSIARQSIVIGILLSVVLMGIFATGKFSPLLGALLQEVVDVFVIFNALRAHTSKAV